MQVLKTLVQTPARMSLDPQKGGEKVARFGRGWSDSFIVVRWKPPNGDQ